MAAVRMTPAPRLAWTKVQTTEERDRDLHTPDARGDAINSRSMRPRALCVLGCLALVGSLDTNRRRPSLNNAASKSGAHSEESLGSQLLTAVLSDDLEAAAAIFTSVSASQGVRLANAIDWRGKSVLMHASYVPPRATIQFQPRHLPHAALMFFYSFFSRSAARATTRRWPSSSSSKKRASTRPTTPEARPLSCSPHGTAPSPL